MTLENRNDETDARLTAYAFGELEGEELAAMEAAVAADPLLAMRVAELRAFGDELGVALANEPALMPLSASAPVAVAMETGESVAQERGRVLRFPAWAWAAAGVAVAASVAVWFGSWEPVVPPEVVRPETARLENIPPPAEVVVPVPGAIAKIGPAPVASIEVPANPSPIPPALEDKTDQAAPAPVIVADLPAAPGETSPPSSPILPTDNAEPDPSPVGSASAAVMVAAVDDSASAATAAIPLPVFDPETEVRAMLDKGRSQYAAGDMDGALNSFVAVKKINARNREAGYYSARIAQEKARAERFAGLENAPGSAGQSPSVEAADERSTTASARRRTGFRAPALEANFSIASSNPVSSFPISYSTPDFTAIRRLTRSMMSQPSMRTDQLGRQMPSVQIEDLINHFPYRYTSSTTPPGIEPEEVFSAHLAVASAPWAPEHRLVRIGIKAVELVSPEGRPAANLVFVVDFSGDGGLRSGISLAKASLLKILEGLRPEDRVAIVTFGPGAKLTFPSTPVSRRGEIEAAIRGLKARGFAPARPGIAFAYDVAQEHFQPELLNRVILCTESSALIAFPNDGRTKGFDPTPTFELVRERARSGVSLHVLGFEYSPFTDHTEKLVENGNGLFRHITSTGQATQLVVGELDGRLAPVASDVRVQVEFNPERVASYRLIGYENRTSVSGSEGDGEAGSAGAATVGSGHTVTALYEIDPAKKRPKRRAAPGAAPADGQAADQLLSVRIQHRQPWGGESRTQRFSLADAEVDFEDADEDFRFAASVAAWGMLLRQSPYAGTATFDAVRKWADDSRDYDPGEYRKDFVKLAKDTRVFERRR